MDDGWQTIDSAPRDGTVIMLYGMQRPHEMLHSDEPVTFSGYFDMIDEAWCGSASTWTGPFYDPTHWMPLPAPPPAQ